MARAHPKRSVKICPVCREGFDAFKAVDARGHHCSPACLAEARRRHREHVVDTALGPVVGPAALPPTISLGSRSSMISLDLIVGDDRRLL